MGRLTFRRTQEGCGGLGRENPAAFPKTGPIFQQPFSLPESAQTLAVIAFRAAGKSGNNFPAASKFAGKPFQQRISDSHSLLESSETCLAAPYCLPLQDYLRNTAHILRNGVSGVSVRGDWVRYPYPWRARSRLNTTHWCEKGISAILAR